MKCGGEAATTGVVGTDGLVSPPLRPSLATAEEGQATGREGRSFSSTVLLGCLPPYAIRDYSVNLQQFRARLERWLSHELTMSELLLFCSQFVLE